MARLSLPAHVSFAQRCLIYSIHIIRFMLSFSKKTTFLKPNKQKLGYKN